MQAIEYKLINKWFMYTMSMYSDSLVIVRLYIFFRQVYRHFLIKIFLKEIRRLHFLAYILAVIYDPQQLVQKVSVLHVNENVII